MNPQEDPEARIRQLEQPLADMARASELGQTQKGPNYGYVPPSGLPYPPPPVYPPGPGSVTFPNMTPTVDHHTGRASNVVPIVVAVVAIAIAGGVTLFMANQPSFSPDRPDFSGGGATLSDGPNTLPAGDVGARPPTVGVVVPDPSKEVLAPGAVVSFGGIGANRTLECNESVVNVSGFENTVVITGRCASVSVSGKDNVVTVDESVAIGVSGFDNRIVFRTGAPEVSNSGFGNTVEQG